MDGFISLQFPYEPDYGDRQSLVSGSAADRLVQEVKEQACHFLQKTNI